MIDMTRPQLNFRVTSELLDKLKVVSDSQNLSVSAYCIRAIEFCLDSQISFIPSGDRTQSPPIDMDILGSVRECQQLNNQAISIRLAEIESRLATVETRLDIPLDNFIHNPDSIRVMNKSDNSDDDNNEVPSGNDIQLLDNDIQVLDNPLDNDSQDNDIQLLDNDIQVLDNPLDNDSQDNDIQLLDNPLDNDIQDNEVPSGNDIQSLDNPLDNDSQGNLASLDDPAAVAYVREHMKDMSSPDISDNLRTMGIQLINDKGNKVKSTYTLVNKLADRHGIYNPRKKK